MVWKSRMISTMGKYKSSWVVGANRGRLARLRPRDRAELRGWVEAMLGSVVPDAGMCGGHVAPMDYLEHVFFERSGDALVWANRGGGKTYYGAVATLLDLLFKPGIEVRVLGGSMDQSMKMYGYLRGMLDQPGLREMIAGKMTRRGVRLKNGSGVELLAQSETSVRGQRVQKLRCDEVELFDREVWQAAQFVTRSAICGGVRVRGSVEVFSTMHKPWGLMNELVEGATGGTGDGERGGDSCCAASGVGEGGSVEEGKMRRGKHCGGEWEIRGSGGGEEARGAGVIGDLKDAPIQSGWKLMRWCALDVMGRCGDEFLCVGCGLWDACGGRAKMWDGFLPVEDVMSQMRRSSRLAFDSEMLCLKPSISSAVFPGFNRAVHVREIEADRKLMWIGGVDFGVRDPFVMLWAQVRKIEGGGRLRIEVLDEYYKRDRVALEHIREMRRRVWPVPRWLGVDPSGGNRNDQTGESTIAVLRRAGFTVRARRMGVMDSVEVLRSFVEPADGGSGAMLVIHPRCERLIESLTCYHFDEKNPRNAMPVKDDKDHDHAVDALRYMVVNLTGGAEGRGY